MGGAAGVWSGGGQRFGSSNLCTPSAVFGFSAVRQDCWPPPGLGLVIKEQVLEAYSWSGAVGLQFGEMLISL